MCASTLLSQLCLWSFVKKYVKKIKVNLKEILIHLKPNLILFIPVIAVNLYRYMDKIMLGILSEKVEVGFYESSDKIINVPMALITSLGTVMLPRVSNLMSNKKYNNASKYIEKSIYFAMFLSTSLCFGIMAVSDVFVPLYYGRGYEKCILLFQILMPSCIFLGFANVIRTQFLIPLKKDKIYVFSVISGAVINLIINIILIPKYASVGASVGTLFAQATVCVYQTVMVQHELPIKKYLVYSIPFILSGLFMYFGLKIFSGIISGTFTKLILEIIIGGILYIVCLLIIIKSFNIKYDILKRKC